MTSSPLPHLQAQAQADFAQMQAKIAKEVQAIQTKKKAGVSAFAKAAGTQADIRFVTITDPAAVITDPAVFATFGTVGQTLTGADVMAAMYPLYEKSFPIDTERTSLEGLCEAMDVNKTPELQNSNQPTQESWVIAFDAHRKKVVGGYNTIAISTANADPAAKKEADAGSLLIYTFVDSAYRAQNLSGRLADVSEASARVFAAQTHADGREAGTMMIVQAAEQNDPRALTCKDIIEDSKGARIDQCDRRSIFNGAYKFGQIDFHYVQPGLEGGDPCEGLNLIARRCPPPGSKAPRVLESMSPQLLKVILENFVEKSIFADAAAYKDDPTWLGMKKDLDKLIAKGASVAIDQGIDFQSGKPHIYAAIGKVVNAQTFDPDAFENATMADLGVPPLGRLETKAATVSLPSHTRTATPA